MKKIAIIYQGLGLKSFKNEKKAKGFLKPLSQEEIRGFSSYSALYVYKSKRERYKTEQGRVALVESEQYEKNGRWRWRIIIFGVVALLFFFVF